MGVVYEALHRDLVRRVAVKVLPRTLDADPAMVERFRREARSCAQIRHPNVVTVYEAGDVDGQLYYAMELVDGRTLQAHIDEGTVPAPRALCAALAEVADALAALHAVGVVHRDVKPANLIVRPDGHLVLADFGLARTLYGSNLTQTGEALGTPPYMSPEQLLGRVRDVDARTDVYGMGATIYHALVGSPPFAARDAQDLVRMVLVQRPEPISRRRPDVEPGVEGVVLKALEKRKEDRYVTAGALRDDLRAVAAGREPQGRPVSPLRRALRAARPYLLPVAAAAALLVGGYAWWASRPGTVAISLPLPADVFADGTLAGRVPDEGRVRLTLASGTHRMKLVGKGFHTDEESVEIAPMGSKSYALGMANVVVTNADDPAVMAEFARFVRLDWRRWAELENTRAAANEVAAVLPRGNVRLSDLDVVELAVPRERNPDTPLVLFFARDGVELVPSRPFPPEETLVLGGDDGETATFPVPAEVRAALRVGDTLQWGVRPARPQGFAPPGPGVARAKIVEQDPDAVLATLEVRLAKQPPDVVAVFRSRLLRDQGLPTAAARAITSVVPRAARGFYAWLALYDALRGAGVPTDLPVVTAAHDAVEARKATDAFRAHPGLVPSRGLAPTESGK